MEGTTGGGGLEEPMLEGARLGESKLEKEGLGVLMLEWKGLVELQGGEPGLEEGGLAGEAGKGWRRSPL